MIHVVGKRLLLGSSFLAPGFLRIAPDLVIHIIREQPIIGSLGLVPWRSLLLGVAAALITMPGAFKKWQKTRFHFLSASQAVAGQ